MRSTRPAIGALIASSFAALSACAVGPNFKRPPPPAATDYGGASAAATTVGTEVAGGGAQNIVAGMDIPGQWWTLFQSPKLDHLVEQSLKANPNVGAAQAALRQAHELYLAERTSFFPNVQGSFGGDRSEFPTSTLTSPTVASSSTYTLYTAQLTLSLCPGCLRCHAARGGNGQGPRNGTRFQLEATYLTLSSNVVVTAVQEASLRGQITATQRLAVAAASIDGDGAAAAGAWYRERSGHARATIGGGPNRSDFTSFCKSNWARLATRSQPCWAGCHPTNRRRRPLRRFDLAQGRSGLAALEAN